MTELLSFHEYHSRTALVSCALAAPLLGEADITVGVERELVMVSLLMGVPEHVLEPLVHLVRR